MRKCFLLKRHRRHWHCFDWRFEDESSSSCDVARGLEEKLLLDTNGAALDEESRSSVGRSVMLWGG